MIILLKFIVCAFLTALLFPPFFILPLGFIAFPFLFILLNERNFLQKSLLFHFISGIVYGLTLNSIILVWIKDPFFTDDTTKVLVPFSYLLVLYCSIYFGFIFLFLKFFKNKFSKLILIPVLFVTIEIIRENFIYGFPWIVFSQIYSGNIYLLNLIYYYGTYGLSFICILFFIFPSLIILMIQEKKYKFKIIIFIFFSILIIVISAILIFLRFNEKNNEKNYDLTISLIQLNSKNNASSESSREERLEEINKIIINNKSDLLIFGENDFPYIIQDHNDLKYISNHLKSNQSVVIGATRKENSKFFNTFVLIESKSTKDFDKIKLVPFGEFLPLRDFLHFLNFFVGKNDFSSGSKTRYMESSNGLKILPIICYEVIFFNNLLNKFNFNSQLLINITNDSWFGDFSGPYQHLYLSIMRAAEFNKPLIRVSNNGISVLTDNRGKIINFIPLNTKGIITSKFTFSNSLSNFVNYHFFIIFILLILFIFAIIVNKKTDE